MDFVDRAIGLEGWYHTIELAPGRVTPGLYDLRPYVHHYGLPDRMDGLRALDIGSQDGFWAFEMERRGAEVTALNHPTGDQDRPYRYRGVNPVPGQSGRFHLAKEALGSSVKHVSLDICDARPEALGTFDVVFAGSVLIHIRDQLLALERIAQLCRGTLISAEPYDRFSSLLPFAMGRYRASVLERARHKNSNGGVDEIHWWYFWKPSIKAWKQMMWTVGFEDVRRRGRFGLRSTWGFNIPHIVHHASKPMSEAPGRDLVVP
jgi:tRNA (mo5U34)-methyltransferase